MTGVVILEAVLITLSLLFITTTALPFIRRDEQWLRMFDFPRMQTALGGVVTVALYLPLWDALRGVQRGATGRSPLLSLY